MRTPIESTRRPLALRQGERETSPSAVRSSSCVRNLVAGRVSAQGQRSVPERGANRANPLTGFPAAVFECPILLAVPTRAPLAAGTYAFEVRAYGEGVPTVDPPGPCLLGIVISGSALLCVALGERRIPAFAVPRRGSAPWRLVDHAREDRRALPARGRSHPHRCRRRDRGDQSSGRRFPQIEHRKGLDRAARRTIWEDGADGSPAPREHRTDLRAGAHSPGKKQPRQPPWASAASARSRSRWFWY